MCVTAAYRYFARKRIVAPAKPRGTPLNLRIDQSLINSGRALDLPKGTIEHPVVKRAAVKNSGVAVHAKPGGEGGRPRRAVGAHEMRVVSVSSPVTVPPSPGNTATVFPPPRPVGSKRISASEP
jgi:hypothetical protein